MMRKPSPRIPTRASGECPLKGRPRWRTAYTVPLAVTTEHPLPWRMGDGCLLDAVGRDVPMYAEAVLRAVLALSLPPGTTPRGDPAR